MKAGRHRPWHRYACAVLVLLSGITNVCAADTAQEEANKKLVNDFYAALNRAEVAGDMKEKAVEIATRYVAADYIQHGQLAAHSGAGREGFIRSMQQVPDRAPGLKLGLPTTIAMMAQGDLVVLVTRRQLPGASGAAEHPVYIFNLFRIHEGKLAEHWDGVSGAMQPPAPAGGAGERAGQPK